MAAGKLIGIGVGGAVLAVICCAAPSLLIVLGSLGLSAWYAATGYLLIPIVLIAIGVVGIGLYRRKLFRLIDRAADGRKVDGNIRRLKS
jgi:mercuric ion transport protein